MSSTVRSPMTSLRSMLSTLILVVLLPSCLSSAHPRSASARLKPVPVRLRPSDVHPRPSSVSFNLRDARPYTEEAHLLPLVEGQQRPKRLMGIFRCNGWGPGCTQLDGAGGGGGGGRRGGDGRHYRGGEDAGSPRSPMEKFQPFFTLTSGGSWGPTGKRSSWLPTQHQRDPHGERRLLGQEDRRLPMTWQSTTGGDTAERAFSTRRFTEIPSAAPSRHALRVLLYLLGGGSSTDAAVATPVRSH